MKVWFVEDAREELKDKQLQPLPAKITLFDSVEEWENNWRSYPPNH